MERIRYTYIPSDKADDGMTQVLFAKDVVFTDMFIIENAVRGVFIEPELKDITKVATEKNLEQVMKKVAANSECESIILNGFDISIDDVRDKYIDFAKQYDVYLCINTLSSEVTKNVTVYLDYAITDISDEEWEKTKEEIKESAKEELKESEETSLSETLLKAMFGGSLDIADAADKLDDIEDIDIDETYTYSNQDEEITIHKLVDNSLVISDGENEVLIGKALIKFLTTSLNSLTKEV